MPEPDEPLELGLLDPALGVLEPELEGEVLLPLVPVLLLPLLPDVEGVDEPELGELLDEELPLGGVEEDLLLGEVEDPEVPIFAEPLGELDLPVVDGAVEVPAPEVEDGAVDDGAVVDELRAGALLLVPDELEPELPLLSQAAISVSVPRMAPTARKRLFMKASPSEVVLSGAADQSRPSPPCHSDNEASSE